MHHEDTKKIHKWDSSCLRGKIFSTFYKQRATLIPAYKAAILACLFLVPAAAWAETHFEASQRLLESGYTTEARRALELELAVRPGNLEARYNLAVLLTRIGHAGNAAKLYLDNIKRGKHLPSVVNLSALYLQQSKRSAAKHLLQQATHRFRAEAVPWYLLAAIAEREHQTKQAEHDYRRALKADRKNGFAHIRYAQFLAKHHRFKPAATHAERAVRILPECAACFRIEGDILRQGGHAKEALAAYQKAAALSPEHSIRLNIIATLNALGQHRRAKRMQQGLQAATTASAP